MRILITGGSGFLGTKLLGRFQKTNEVLGTYSSRPRQGLKYLDITKFDPTRTIIQSFQPDLVIHTSAVSDIDYCQEHKVEARLVNVEGSRNVARAASAVHAKLIHISTWAVFGKDKPPYHETGAVNPTNYYGETKAEAEQIVRELVPSSSILRLDMLYGYNGPDLPNGIVGKILDENIFSVNTTQIRRPLLVDDVIKATRRIIEFKGSGIYHLCGLNAITKYEFCRKLEKFFGKSGVVQAIDVSLQKGQRNDDSTLAMDRLHELNMTTTPIADAIEKINKQVVIDKLRMMTRR